MRCVSSSRFGASHTALAAIVLLAASQSPTHLLRLTDEVGQANRYRLAFDIQMRASYSGDGQPDARTRQLMDALADGMVLHSAVEYEQVLVAIEADETRAFEVRWHDFDYTGEIGDQPIPPPATLVESTQELLSQTARVRTSPTGQTIDVTYSHPKLAGLARSFEQVGGSMPTYLPEAPVRVGDSWTSEGRFPVGLSANGTESMTLELEHTLLELRQGNDGLIAVIGMSGSYSQLQGIEEAGFGAPMHVQIDMTGSALFDVTRGRYVGGRYEIDMFALLASGEVEIELTGHASGTLELLNAR